MPTDKYNKVYIIGAGGHALVVFDALRASGWSGDVELRDAAVRDTFVRLGLTVTQPALPDGFGGETRVHVAIGDNLIRRRLSEEAKRRGGKLLAVVHPGATVSASACVAPGVFIGSGAILGPLAVAGEGAIINHRAIVDHECEVGAYAHVAPGAVLGGKVQVEPDVLVGAGATVLPGVALYAASTVGAGAVVLRNVARGSLVVGVPARPVLDRSGIDNLTQRMPKRS